MNKAVKNPGVAAMLSFFWCGLGQIYNGQLGKGFAFMFGFMVSVALITVGIGLISTPILWICGIVDAYQPADQLNQSEEEVYEVAVPVRKSVDGQMLVEKKPVQAAIAVAVIGAITALALMVPQKKAFTSDPTPPVAAASTAVAAAVATPVVSEGVLDTAALINECGQSAVDVGKETSVMFLGCTLYGTRQVRPVEEEKTIRMSVQQIRKHHPKVSKACAQRIVELDAEVVSKLADRNQCVELVSSVYERAGK